MLERWKSDDQLFILLSPPFRVTMEVDRVAMGEVLTQSVLSPEDFRAASDEIGLILLNVLNRTEGSYVLGPGGVDGADDEDPEIQAARKRRGARVEEVRSRLCDDRLQRRYDLKKSSKTPSFNGIDWDVEVKHFDANVHDFQPFAYATLRLSFQRDFEDSALAVLGGRTFDSVQINFSRDEIDHSIGTLSRVRDRLATLEEGRA